MCVTRLALSPYSSPYSPPYTRHLTYYAQGAYRMRGIGKGQTIHLYIIPEVLHRILKDLDNLGDAITAGMQVRTQ